MGVVLYSVANDNELTIADLFADIGCRILDIGTFEVGSGIGSERTRMLADGLISRILASDSIGVAGAFF